MPQSTFHASDASAPNAQTLPADAGYSGASVWGSTPAIDQKRNALYVSTGNNYSLPPARSACIAAAANDAAKRACLPGDHLDSILALDLSTGRSST